MGSQVSWVGRQGEREREVGEHHDSTLNRYGIKAAVLCSFSVRLLLGVNAVRAPIEL